MNRRGFTLVELLVMMVVLGLLIGISVPNITGIVATQKANSFKDDALKLINDAKILVMSEGMTKPADGESFVFTLDYLDTGDQYVNGPYGGEYLHDESFVIYKREGNQYQYYVRLVEGTSKGNYGINLATPEMLSSEDATKLIEEITEEAPIPTGATIDSLSSNNLINSLCGEGSIRRLNDNEQKTKFSTPHTFATDDWVTILYNLGGANVNAYNVGDKRQVELAGFGTHTIRISNLSPCTGTQSQTACGVVLEFTDSITTYKMNNTDNNSVGWKNSTLRSYLNSTIYNSLPTELKNAIIDTTVVTGHGTSSSSNVTTTDKLYLLSPKEVLGGSTSATETASSTTRQLDYYTLKGTSDDKPSYARKHSEISAQWWLRTPVPNKSDQYYYITFRGEAENTYASKVYGIAPAFRLS